jgi:hypothetical protein
MNHQNHEGFVELFVLYIYNFASMNCAQQMVLALTFLQESAGPGPGQLLQDSGI